MRDETKTHNEIFPAQYPVVANVFVKKKDNFFEWGVFLNFLLLVCQSGYQMGMSHKGINKQQVV